MFMTILKLSFNTPGHKSTLGLGEEDGNEEGNDNEEGASDGAVIQSPKYVEETCPSKN